VVESDLNCSKPLEQILPGEINRGSIDPSASTASNFSEPELFRTPGTIQTPVVARDLDLFSVPRVTRVSGQVTPAELERVQQDASDFWA
jgi:hypothetical protein